MVSVVLFRSFRSFRWSRFGRFGGFVSLFRVLVHAGIFLLKCNYEIKDLNISLNVFYSELLAWWQDFRNSFVDINYTQNVIWNNKDVEIDNNSVFYCSYYDRGITYINDLSFELDNVQSHDFYRQGGLKTDLLTWMALRLSIPKEFRTCTSTTNLDSITFKHNNVLFDTYEAKSKQFYKLLITNTASLPNKSKKLISDFDISDSLEDILFNSSCHCKRNIYLVLPI